MDTKARTNITPLVDQAAIDAAEDESRQRKAAIEREEQARQAAAAAARLGYHRAPDREAPRSWTHVDDPDAPERTPNTPLTPFETVGLDGTALNHYESLGVTMSDETKGKLAEAKAAQAPADSQTSGGVVRVSAEGERTRANPQERSPSDAQTRQTASSVQTSEPQDPNDPDLPSRPNQDNKPAAEKTTRSTKTAAADKT